MKGRIVLLAVATLLCAWPIAPGVRAADAALKASPPSGIKIEFDAENVGPRQIENTTEAAILRDYATAWKARETALSQNRTDILDSGFVGVARERLAQRVADQRKTGLRAHYVDRGHKLLAIFYSPEGSTMQLRDTAQYDLELLDRNTVVSSQPVTQTYIALMSVTEDRWKVRVLQTVETVAGRQ